MSKKQIIYDMDGNEIGVSNEQSRPITSSIETIEEINQVDKFEFVGGKIL